MFLFCSQFSERLGIHGLTTLSRQTASPARVRPMENPVVEVAIEQSTDESEIIQSLMVTELLVEEISIDGMCGVY